MGKLTKENNSKWKNKRRTKTEKGKINEGEKQIMEK